MAMQKMTIVAVAAVLLVATASAARDTGMGRELKQATPLPTVAPLPTIPAGTLPNVAALPPIATIPAIPNSGSDPFLSAISRIIDFLNQDVANLQSVVGGAASGLDSTVSSTVQSFEKQLATALEQLQTAISGILGQGTTVGGTGQTNLNTFLSAFTSQNPVAAILRTALPPAAAGRR
ncbi:hypothetical protein COCOBI_14-1770 [Coccomyxa sp. Obi]|nr:hypothetical protein COCOBI_14-1770 [Coccomyxa sp. Obi]